MPLQVAIYCRISQDRKGEGLGVARQEKDCRQLAERHGWDVAEVLVDNDVSAYSGKPRRGYERLLAMIEGDEIDAVVAWSPDRLHRAPAELETFIDLVEAHKVRIQTVQAGDYDLSTAAGRMSARVVGAVARHESEVKSERIRRKHEELAERGRPSGGGKRPFGYQADRMTLDAAEAALIRDAADRILAGDSLRSIVRDWRDRGVPSVSGAPWQGTTVKRLLCSARIAGYREHKGKLAGKASWPAIITPEELTRIRAILTSPERRKSSTSARRYLLVGFVRCGRCGAAMASRATGKGVRRYVCHADRGCGRCGIAAEPLEELIVEAVLSRFDGTTIPTKGRTDHDDKLAEIEALEQRLADLSEDYAAGHLSRIELRVGGERIRERLDVLRSELAADLVDSGVGDRFGEPGELRRAWPTLTFDRRRAVLALAVESVTISPTTRATNYFDPERVEAIAWRV
jgi:site-specific DNA recombinase